MPSLIVWYIAPAEILSIETETDFPLLVLMTNSVRINEKGNKPCVVVNRVPAWQIFTNAKNV